jgi:hypothetical protein
LKADLLLVNHFESLGLFNPPPLVKFAEEQNLILAHSESLVYLLVVLYQLQLLGTSGMVDSPAPVVFTLDAEAWLPALFTKFSWLPFEYGQVSTHLARPFLVKPHRVVPVDALNVVPAHFGVGHDALLVGAHETSRRVQEVLLQSMASKRLVLLQIGLFEDNTALAVPELLVFTVVDVLVRVALVMHYHEAQVAPHQAAVLRLLSREAHVALPLRADVVFPHHHLFEHVLKGLHQRVRLD